MSAPEQPVGPIVTGESAFPNSDIQGQYCSLQILKPSHAPSLYRHLGREENGWRWTYMLSGPYLNEDDFTKYVQGLCDNKDLVAFAVVVGDEAVGMMSYISIVPGHRRLEIGSVIFGEVLKRTRESTEAVYLALRHAIEELGYRRVEWKANNLNKPSATAARRLGFTYEGVFRNHMIIKGRNRDTIWFSITVDEWPSIKARLDAWLAPDNFDANGQQKKKLQEI